MKKKTYQVLTHIPILGSIIKISTQIMWCGPGLADGVYKSDFQLIREFEEKHPDIQMTRQLLDRIRAEKNREVCK